MCSEWARRGRIEGTAINYVCADLWLNLTLMSNYITGWLIIHDLQLYSSNTVKEKKISFRGAVRVANLPKRRGVLQELQLVSRLQRCFPVEERAALEGSLHGIPSPLNSLPSPNSASKSSGTSQLRIGTIGASESGAVGVGERNLTLSHQGISCSRLPLYLKFICKWKVTQKGLNKTLSWS